MVFYQGYRNPETVAQYCYTIQVNLSVNVATHGLESEDVSTQYELV